MKKVILSGMRPTGKLHLGHWVGALSNWVNLQKDYKCFFMAADWHALMSEYKNPSATNDFIFDNVCDWLSYGIDPKHSVIFVQSQVPEHLELFAILSFLTPLGWLYRCPTFKEQIAQLKDKEINTYAFLGYPVLQAADITLYKANAVPVGDDQLPHLELAREIVRRFNSTYKREVLLEPQAILTPTPRLLGLDGRKMSKSYNNYIALDEDDKSIKNKISNMITDPQRIKKEDKGRPDVCNVYSYYSVFAKDKASEVYDWCTGAKKGCVECKKIFTDLLIEFIAPHREKKREFLKKKDYIYDILKEGTSKAREIASKTIVEAKEAMGL
ncbi:MAG: tryptophan--tRNA ligase [Candidatus Omnitrophica bacterium]|jgi:tryptophanyl-tRNA synthetase|nr:tryptophan--tRNA ligase [Candidatus Omnitrophota bacterium]